MADISIDTDPQSPTYLDWLLDETGDVVMTSDVQTNGTHPVLQAIIMELRAIRGEWFMDTSSGTPWLSVLGRKGITADEIAAMVSAQILGIDGVLQLSRLDVDPDFKRRRVDISFKAETVRGAVTGVVPISLNGGA